MLTDHAVQLAIVLEDALMSDATLVRDFMVRDPACAQPWQPVSAVRQVMLSRSYSFMPIHLAGVRDDAAGWFLLSDAEIARYLRSAEDSNERRRRLAASVSDAIASRELTPSPAATCTPEQPVRQLLTSEPSWPLLVTEPAAPTRLVGVITPFDLL
jgi:hypothetical protein